MVEEGTQKVDKELEVPEKKEEENEEDAARNDFAEEKGVIPPPDHKTAPPVKENVADLPAEKCSGGLVDRDAALAKVANEKRLALIKAWEESEKTKTENKAYKKLSAVESWENSSKASVDAQLKKIEEKFEKKKAEYGEKMKNKLAAIHRAAEEKRATVEAKRWEEIIKVEDTATKFRTAGYVPRNLLGCFSY